MDNSILIYILLGFFIGIVFISLTDDIVQYVYKHTYYSKKDIKSFEQFKDYKRYQELKQKFESEDKSNEKIDTWFFCFVWCWQAVT